MVPALRVAAAFAAVSCCLALSTEEWKRRTIYQVITDRFALSDQQDGCDTGGCPYGNYCGGSFQGIAAQLPYITGAPASVVPRAAQ